VLCVVVPKGDLKSLGAMKYEQLLWIEGRAVEQARAASRIHAALAFCFVRRPNCASAARSASRGAEKIFPSSG
jgi:hypothetical protein